MALDVPYMPDGSPVPEHDHEWQLRAVDRYQGQVEYIYRCSCGATVYTLGMANSIVNRRA